MGGFLTNLWHHAAARATNDYHHPMDGVHDLSNFAYNISGAHDVVGAAEDPTNWMKDLKAGAVIGGYVLPGMLAGRALGRLGADTVARYGSGALPGAIDVASDPLDPQGYVNTVLGAVPGAIPTPGVDNFVQSHLGASKQQAIMEAIASKIATRSVDHAPSYLIRSAISSV